MLKNAWAPLSPSIKNIINEVGFDTFFEALLNHETLPVPTFHFLGIGEVMLTPYNFSVIIGLRLGGKRILVNDSFTSTQLKKLLGLMPSKMRSNNIHLSWLYESIPQCETVVKGTRMFVLLFIGTFLCPNLGNIMNMRYLGSLRKIEQIWNYDWGHGLCYSDAFHDPTLQVNPFKLGWGSICMAGEVWDLFWLCVGFGKLFGLCMGFGKLFWLYGNGVVNFSGLDVQVLWSWS